MENAREEQLRRVEHMNRTRRPVPFEVRSQISKGIWDKLKAKPSAEEMARRARIGWKRSPVGSRISTKGEPKSTETKKRMSNAALLRKESMAERASGPKTPEWRFGQAERVRLGVSGYRLSKRSVFTDRLGRVHRMRSVWEVLTAFWLDQRDYAWDYEPVSLRLQDGSAYLPDFRLASGKFLEVKGYSDPTSMEKVKQARLMGHRVQLLDEKMLRRLGVLSLLKSPEWKAVCTFTTSKRQPKTST